MLEEIIHGFFPKSESSSNNKPSPDQDNNNNNNSSSISSGSGSVLGLDNYSDIGIHEELKGGLNFNFNYSNNTGGMFIGNEVGDGDGAGDNLIQLQLDDMFGLGCSDVLNAFAAKVENA